MMMMMMMMMLIVIGMQGTFNLMIIVMQDYTISS